MKTKMILATMIVMVAGLMAPIADANYNFLSPWMANKIVTALNSTNGPNNEYEGWVFDEDDFDVRPSPCDGKEVRGEGHIVVIVRDPDGSLHVGWLEQGVLIGDEDCFVPHSLPVRSEVPYDYTPPAPDTDGDGGAGFGGYPSVYDFCAAVTDEYNFDYCLGDPYPYL